MSSEKSPESLFREKCAFIESEQKKGRRKCVLSSKALNWVCKNIPRDSPILEFGSGKSSEILSLLFKVDSVEHDPKYLGKCPRVFYIYAPIRDYGKYLWYDIAPIAKNIREKYSLIIVDGPTAKTGREGFALNYELFSKFNCPVLIDETDRKTEAKILECFLESGFEKLFWGKDFCVVKPAQKNQRLNENCLSSLTLNENLVVCSMGDVNPPKWLARKKGYDVCIIHSGSNVDLGQEKLKPYADYFITEKGSPEHNCEIAFREIPKLGKYSKAVYLADSKRISPESLLAFFRGLKPRSKISL